MRETVLLNHFDLKLTRELLQTQINLQLAIVGSGNSKGKEAFDSAVKLFDEYRNILNFEHGVTTNEKEKIKLEADKFNNVTKDFKKLNLKVGKKVTTEFASMGIKDIINMVK